MVDKIKISTSLRATFRYNENKVEQGVADLLGAYNYPMDLDQMNKEHRLNMLLKLAARRPSVTHNSVHISLNFAPGEVLPQAKLCLIANDYMEAIGFGDQPYLIYQHYDAGHPHIHLVSVKVNAKGDRMKTHFDDRFYLNKLRQGLEHKYGLVRAEEHKRDLYQLKPATISKAEYGKTETKRAITNILESIIPRYNFTSLGEFNAILKGYNITANPGGPDSRTRKHKGLVYHILNPEGMAVGVPVPASHIPMEVKPTLVNLEKRFLKNKLSRAGEKPRVKYLMDMCLRKFKAPTFADLTQELGKNNVRLVIHENETGQIFGLTYVDYQQRTAYNGTTLGPAYSANAIVKRCSPKTISTSLQDPQTAATDRPSESLFGRFSDLELFDLNHFFGIEHQTDHSSSSGGGLIEILTRSEGLSYYLPYELRKKKKRRKKRKPETL